MDGQLMTKSIVDEKCKFWKCTRLWKSLAVAASYFFSPSTCRLLRCNKILLDKVVRHSRERVAFFNHFQHTGNIHNSNSSWCNSVTCSSKMEIGFIVCWKDYYVVGSFTAALPNDQHLLVRSLPVSVSRKHFVLIHLIMLMCVHLPVRVIVAFKQKYTENTLEK